MANFSNINNKLILTDGGNVLIGQTAAVGTSKLQVTGNSTFAGNVGINETSLTEKLEVDGAIVWKGALTTSKTSAGVLDRSGDSLRIRAYGATAGSGNLHFRTGAGQGYISINFRGNFSGIIKLVVTLQITLRINFRLQTMYTIGRF